jgi:CrcB protein
MKSFLLVFLGSGAGGCLRYAITGLMQQINFTGNFPWPTLLSNVLACMLAGFLGGRYLPGGVISETGRLLLITGFCGGFSTFSAFSVECLQLMRAGLWFSAAAYLLLSLAAGLAAVWTFFRSA